VGLYRELLVNNGRVFGFMAFSCITLLMLLFGQRLAKDYDGTNIVIYFIPAVMAVYWLN
jgi:hypothetical protein